jgi:hypothetical protein
MIAVIKITWIINDLFTKSILCSGAIPKNNKIVISPLGATKVEGIRVF